MVDLPKDAEGRGIPLDTEVPYDENGNEYEVHRYGYPVRRTVPQRKRRVVAMDRIAHDVPDLHIAPPDSREKLPEDLKAVEDYGNSPHIDSPTCRHSNMVGKPCGRCEFHGSGNRARGMCADIAYRIREPRGEDE